MNDIRFSEMDDEELILAMHGAVNELEARLMGLKMAAAGDRERIAILEAAADGKKETGDD